MILHELTDDLALLSTVGQGIILLLLLIQRVNYIEQVAGWEVMQAIGWVRVSEHDDQRPVEVGRAVHLKLISERISLEFIAVAL